ncbi:TRAP transporter small permease [Roseospira navarrensis]|uniref:TRAP transporter small permease protein n=1 Tax=Roseospira navarrensis TaxID=140058 RepID=A0A7X1ZHY8_9PROT|nr:TRAP transporter small permease [Roseospira navarrensis]MQX37802.1 TRAP transporter small permease subunit [Roseospira navarrensis]
MLDAARRVLGRLGRVEVALAMAALAATCGVTAVQAVVRTGFGGSLLWAEEVGLLLLKIMIFVGAAGVYKARAFITIDTLMTRAPEALKRPLMLAAWTVSAVFGAVVAWQGALLYPSQIITRTYLLELPRFVFTMPIIYAGASIALTSLFYIVWLLSARGRAVGTTEAEDAASPLARSGEAH